MLYPTWEEFLLRRPNQCFLLNKTIPIQYSDKKLCPHQSSHNVVVYIPLLQYYSPKPPKKRIKYTYLLLNITFRFYHFYLHFANFTSAIISECFALFSGAVSQFVDCPQLFMKLYFPGDSLSCHFLAKNKFWILRKMSPAPKVLNFGSDYSTQLWVG